jgi:hypothetical protein
MKNYLFSIIFLFLCVNVFSQTIEYDTISFVDSNKTLRLNIDVKYPAIIKYKDVTAQKKINAIIQIEIKQTIDTFVNNIKDYDLSSVPEEFTTSFESGFEIYYSQDDIFSFSYDIYEYVAGAAHPYSYSKAMNLNLSNTKRIGLSDMFKKGDKDLKIISDFCHNDLKKQGKENGYDFDEEMFKEGLDPTAENFQNICITPDGLYIIFNAYQVLAYVFGPQSVTMPYSELKNIINPEGPLKIFIK